MDFQILVVALQIVFEAARLLWLLMGVLTSWVVGVNSGRPTAPSGVWITRAVHVERTRCDPGRVALRQPGEEPRKRSRLAAEDAGRQEVLMAFLDGRKKVSMFSLAVHR